MPADGTRDDVCDKHADWLQSKPELLDALPELKGKVLACWCHSQRCHGDHLAMLADAGNN